MIIVFFFIEKLSEKQGLLAIITNLLSLQIVQKTTSCLAHQWMFILHQLIEYLRWPRRSLQFELTGFKYLKRLVLWDSILLTEKCRD